MIKEKYLTKIAKKHSEKEPSSLIKISKKEAEEIARKEAEEAAKKKEAEEKLYAIYGGD